ncbi:hypothetical protein FA13DRAFT_949615 [Coprinellus micaceus]|uniref:DUF6535 domain-containing protein n=1 Tax=Coprinellus micaceus TaxID=71717 RepID=A0A4Y7T037_COPMI|nr:hypothetical protein FA13DRAFT_949615 [Coprinellus micaceus]
MYAANHDKEISEMEQRLKDVLLKNQRMFARESPYLDALLVYAGLFSAVLAAFLIEARKGLEEDTLDKILKELKQTDEPFTPTTISKWVNGLWFASLSLSLASALFVILAKAMGRRVLDREEIEAMFSSKDSDSYGGSRGEPDCTGRYKFQHKVFKRKFEFLNISATITISASLTLFYPGLVVLIYTSQRGIAWSVAAIAVAMGLVSFTCVLHDVYSAPRYDTE